jgi:hypothetical protein
MASLKNYSPKDKPAPLLSLYRDSVRVMPESFVWDKADSIAVLRYSGGMSAKVKIENKKSYLRFELLSVEPRTGVEAIIWGPYPVRLNKWIGETVGIVRDDDFSIGIQALNVNTMEGLPEKNDNYWSGAFIEPLPGQILPDSLKGKTGERIALDVNRTGDIPEYVRIYRGRAAVKKYYGSELRLFSRDRRIRQTTGAGNNTEYIPAPDADFVGSAIAVFGCPEPRTLDILEKIELGEHLPHPMIDGVWVKRWPLAGQAYLMYDDASPENGLKYAKAFGFKLLHIGDIFEKGGYFGLKTKRFPNGAEDIKRLSDTARNDGILLGVHNPVYRDSCLDPDLLNAYTDRLADVCMETGVGMMDFDGFSENGMNQDYRTAKFIDRWYKKLDEYRLNCGLTISHYYWHACTFMNWGELWNNSALSESRMNYRIENQQYCERNLIPGMLGKFKVDPDYRTEEIEWIQARSAAFDAGYLLHVYDHLETNGFKDEMYEAVREWQRARHANAFSAGQRKRMRNPKNEFHLEKLGTYEWKLYPVTFKRNLSHAFWETSAGESVVNTFDFENPYSSRPAQFYVTVQTTAGNQTASVNSLSITFNNSHTLDIAQPLKAGDRLYCDGKEVYLCDSQWNKIRTVYSGKAPVWDAGANRITVRNKFSGNRAPALIFELKATGDAETVIDI